MSSLPRTLILDYRDSYTNNLLTLFVQLFSDEELARQVVIVQADSLTWEECQVVLEEVDCVILSPGPGRPDNPSDVGYALDLIRTTQKPLLGICLGLQSLAVAYGGKIINTPNLRHGHLIPISHSSHSLFSLLPSHEPIEMVAYNSLTVDPESIPEELEVIACARETLLEDSDPFQENPPGAKGKGKEVFTIQGLAHKSKPQWGVQFHPESIASSHGSTMLTAFLDRVREHHHTLSFPPLASKLLRLSSTASKASPSTPGSDIKYSPPKPISRLELWSEVLLDEKTGGKGELDVMKVFDEVFRERKSVLGEIWLDGVSPNAPTTSSMAIPSFILTYSVSNRRITLLKADSASIALTKHTLHLPSVTTFWDWFAEGQKALKASLDQSENTKSSEENEVRWEGGWIGWWGYEMKAESLGGYHQSDKHLDGREGNGMSQEDGAMNDDVDACWCWCDRILEKQADGKWLARGIIQKDINEVIGAGAESGSMLSWLIEAGINLGITSEDWMTWAKEISASLKRLEGPSRIDTSIEMPLFRADCTAESYQAGIQKCRDAIYAGDSYELTLTTTFSAQPLKSCEDEFALYCKLRRRNPAPHSSFFNLPSVGMTILSSSPERFLKISKGGNIQMKPIKGTKARVRCMCGSESGKFCDGPGGKDCAMEMMKRDAAIGEALRTDGKERAENLMIVDLIRSDLQSCCVSSSVQVPKLIALETYETVHQLVTTVIGKLEEGVDEVQAVKRCFPPGSMTGAPKLRSVQILEELEAQQRRGIYSGAIGYISLNGATDLSVVIRTIVISKQPSFSAEEGCNRNGNKPTMKIGAGGAITWLSKPDAEWEEVLTKVRSVTGRT